MPESRAGCPAQRLLRRELAAEGVDVLAEPVAQWRELSAADLLLELGDVAAATASQICTETTVPMR